jgi:exodeoxyribonuclease VII large subunit
VGEAPFGVRRRGPPTPALRASAADLAPAEGSAEAPFIFSVSGLQRRLRAEVEKGFGLVHVGGEISSLTHHGVSGHAYFVLKDEQAQLRCVMWKEHVHKLRYKLANGMEVIVRGRVTVFERSGQLQLTAQSIERQGDGMQEEAFRVLAEQLRQEGLTSPSRKRRVPLLPRAVGIVTSKSGAALRDILRAALRRDPFTHLLFAPTAVQGQGAEQEIAQALTTLDELGVCDVIILARGGGSREDLWAFNSELVARAVAACRAVVVTGVGHETDTCIADLVADLSCSTPTAAVEHVVPLRAELRHRLALDENRLRRALRSEVQGSARRLMRLEARLHAQDPALAMQRKAQTLDELATRAERSLRIALGRRQQQLSVWSRRLARLEPRAKMAALGARIQILRARQDHTISRRVEAARQRLGELVARLEALSPLAVLSRGYALATTDTGRVVRAASEVTPGERLHVRLGEGSLTARVEEIE